MHATRKQIRNYLRDMLRDSIDVGGRVYVGRGDSPLLAGELPAVCITVGAEQIEPLAGSRYLPNEYERKLSIAVSVVVEQPYSVSSVDEGNEAEDLLDDYLGHVERVLLSDRRLAKRLDGYDPNDSFEGLTHGMRFVSSLSYGVNAEGDRRVVERVLELELPYNTPGDPGLRLANFEEYRVNIVDPEDTDKVLMAAEGFLNA